MSPIFDFTDHTGAEHAINLKYFLKASIGKNSSHGSISFAVAGTEQPYTMGELTREEVEAIVEAVRTYHKAHP